MAIRGDVPANGGDTQYLVSKFLRYCGRFFVPTLKSGVNLLIKKFGWRQPRVIEKLPFYNMGTIFFPERD